MVKTAVITAGATSILWMVFGGAWFDMLDRNDAEETGADTNLAEAPGGMDEDYGDTSVAVGEAKGGYEDVGAPVPPPAARPNVALPRKGITIPVNGVGAADLTDTFFQPRGAGGERVHEAIDIMAESGTAVVAAADGTIAKLHNTGPGEFGPGGKV